jgi:hypothetical protein
MTYRVTFAVDPHPFSRGGSVAICAVSALHLFQAFMLVWVHSAGNATPLRALLFVFWQFGVGLWLAIPLLSITATSALVATTFRLGWVRLFMLAPQHLFLGIMAAGGLYAAYRGTYLDGTVIPWGHILVDQLPVTALWVIHTSAILRRAWDPNG